MFHAPIVADRELKTAEQEIASGPIAGIAVALPISLAIWAAIIVGIVHLCF